MSHLKPPFTITTAHQKVKAAQALWNTQNPTLILPAYTHNSIWRNRTTFLRGHPSIHAFLTRKWQGEKNYRLRKELFAFAGNKIAVQFWYEFQDAWDVVFPKEDGRGWEGGEYGEGEGGGGGLGGGGQEGKGGQGQIAQGRMRWKRCYGLEDWTFDDEGKMEKRMMSGNDLVLVDERERWFREGVDVDAVEIGEEHW